jgi:hypothetical protein
MYAPHSMTWYTGSLVNNAMTYTRQVVEGVMWEESKAANVIKSGSMEADRVRVYVPDIAVGFKVGDYLVKGVVANEITTSFKIADLLKLYPHSVKITSVDLKDYGFSGMQHIQIGGA